MNFPACNRTNLLSILPSLSRGGAEIQVIDLINGLDNELFNKSLVVFESNLSLINKIDRDIIYFQHISRMDLSLLKVAKRVSSLIDEKKIDVVHCSLQVALLVGWLARLFSARKPRLVVTLHTTINRNFKNELIDRLIYQWLMRSCDKIIFVCQNQLEFWAKKYSFIRAKSTVIYNGIDPSYFDPQLFLDSKSSMLQKLGLKETDIVVCNIAGFRPEKGQAILLGAFSEVLRAVPEAVLLFVGDGIKRAEIEEKVKEFNIGDRVKFLGVLEDVRPVLAISSLSVQASTAVETFSIAMLESLSMGVPMVATNVGGTSEAIISGKTGELVEPGSIRALSLGIISLLSKNEKLLDLALSSRVFVETGFTRDLMAINYQKALIGSLVA